MAVGEAITCRLLVYLITGLALSMVCSVGLIAGHGLFGRLS